VKPCKPTLVALQELVQDFFEKHLTVERHASRHTILAYRDSLKLFLCYAADRIGCAVDELDYAALDVNVVRSFLESLQTQRKCGARTRNHRLAAIKAFMRYVASVAPEHLERCRRIRELPPARFEHPEIQYLDDDEMVKLVKATDSTGQRGSSRFEKSEPKRILLSSKRLPSGPDFAPKRCSVSLIVTR
jgi:site-specific recombinase XerD